MRERIIKLIVFAVFVCLQSYGQDFNYQVSLEPVTIDSLGGLQSYAIATHNDEWLLIGGRLDGLHRRQPFAAFDAAGNNNQIIVVNPNSNSVWKATYANLPAPIKEQLSSTNMQFLQDDKYLILTGGYAYSPTSEDHITFPSITIVDVESLIEEVKNNNVSANSFMQKTDQKFAATGGALERIDNTYYLVGGHRFDGRYNPMGPDHGPGFEQEYTDEIRPFNIVFEDDDFTVEHLAKTHDEMHLHRRDYNLLPQMKSGIEELMIFSGVFQNTSNIPWLYPVSITKDSYEPIEDFTQQFNHYHCASIPIYNEDSDEMHNVFFGGIAQFYWENELLVQDNDIPFVNTIADVTRTKNGTLSEKTLDAIMPGYLGAGSQFIVLDNIERYNNGVVKGDEISSESMEIGYIYGGIRSTMPNIFFTNEGDQSEASSTVYKVSISKTNSVVKADELSGFDNILIYPNPAQDVVRMSIELDVLDDIKVEVFDVKGNSFNEQVIAKSELKSGKNYITLNKLHVPYGAYMYKITMHDKVVVRKVIWSE